jgi:hypothetical protein
MESSSGWLSGKTDVEHAYPFFRSPQAIRCKQIRYFQI